MPTEEAPARSRFTIAVITGAGLFSLGLTAWNAWMLAALLRHAAHTIGQVIVANPHPTIRFTDALGRTVDFVQNGFVTRPAGSDVPVIYDPADPAATAQADIVWTTWGTALWMLPAGIVFTAAGLFEGVQTWRRQPRSTHRP